MSPQSNGWYCSLRCAAEQDTPGKWMLVAASPIQSSYYCPTDPYIYPVYSITGPDPRPVYYIGD